MENIIEYCSTYYGTHCGGLECIFVDPTYLQLDDGAFDNEDCNQDLVDKVDIVGIVWLMAMDEDSCFDSVDVPKVHMHPWIQP